MTPPSRAGRPPKPSERAVSAAEEAFVPAGFALKSAVFRGLKTCWLDNGNERGDVLFFLHGYLDTPLSWAPQLEAFAERFRVLVPYGRGVGPSEPPQDTRRYGVFSMLLDHLEILRLTDPKGEKSVHVIGHDLGGVHAWMLACHPFPNLKSVCILNSVHPRQYLRRLLGPRQIFKSWYMGVFQLPYISEALLLLFNRQVLDWVRREGWQAPQGGLTLKEFEGAALNAMNQYRRFVRDIPEFLRDHSGPTRVPALVISSVGDKYLEEPSALEFSDIAGDVTIRVVKGKHWVHREQPERINRLLSEFWSRHP